MQVLRQSRTWQISYRRRRLRPQQKIRWPQLKGWSKGRCCWSRRRSLPRASLECHKMSKDDSTEGGWQTSFLDKSAYSVRQRKKTKNTRLKWPLWDYRHEKDDERPAEKTKKTLKYIYSCPNSLYHCLCWQTVSFSYVCNGRSKACLYSSQ